MILLETCVSIFDNYFKNTFLSFQNEPRRSKSDAIEKLYKNSSRTNRPTSSFEYFSVADGHESGNDSDDDINDSVMETIETVLLNIDAESDEDTDRIESECANVVTLSDAGESEDKGRGWRRKEFEVEVQPFPIFDETSENDMTPLLYFKSFFSNEMFHEIADETNRYYFQNKSPKTLDTNPKEIEILVGILFKMGVVQMPSVRDYRSVILKCLELVLRLFVDTCIL